MRAFFSISLYCQWWQKCTFYLGQIYGSVSFTPFSRCFLMTNISWPCLLTLWQDWMSTIVLLLHLLHYHKCWSNEEKMFRNHLQELNKALELLKSQLCLILCCSASSLCLPWRLQASHDEAMLCNGDAGCSCVTHLFLKLTHFSIFLQQRSSLQSYCTRVT